jgi:protein-L-isoaspartate(D-aspartate) O-methyltransferase
MDVTSEHHVALDVALSAPPDDSLDTLALRQQLVGLLRTNDALHDEAVTRALLRVPRHLFIPHVPLDQAYADAAIPTHWENGVPVSSASQPAIVALMLEQLQLAPGMRVLEIGAGTGYNAALLSDLVGPSGQVTTMDIDPEIAEEARAHLAAAGYTSVRVLAGDGCLGDPDAAPYDRVILTVGASDICPAWFEQLVEGGLLVLPLWLRAAEASVAFRKRDGRLCSESLTPCGFMRLRGAQAATDKWVALPSGWQLGGERAQDLVDPIACLLATRPRRRLWLRPPQAFAQYLGLRGVSLIALWPDPRRADCRKVHGRLGLYLDAPEGPSLALFSPGHPFLLAYGTSAAERLIETEAACWRRTRLAPLDSWQVSAYPTYAGAEPTPQPDDVVRVARRHFVFDICIAGLAQTAS